MNFSISNILNSLHEFWKKLTNAQKVVIIVAPLIVAVSLFSLIFWASRPEYVALFNKLSVNEAAQITAELQELKYPYKLEDGGTTILVPQKDVAEIRLQLANAGLPKESTFSFENLDQIRLGETDADRKLRFILGLQNELEKTIKTLDGVEYARVHIVMPEESLFLEDKKEATAAVTLKTAYGTTLNDDQVRAIANLLAYSVEGLKTENVTIVDTNGNVLSDFLSADNTPHKLTAKQIQVQQAVEENIQKSVQSMLDKVFGPGTTVVRANAKINFDQKTITSQVSENGALVSRQETSETTTNESTPGGVPGIDNNVYESPAYPVVVGATNSSSERTSVTENYQPSVIQEETVVSPGQIERLTISVMADADSVTEQQLDNIEAIVATATGIDLERGDLIQVARLPFNKSFILEQQAALEELARQERLMLYGQIAAGILISLILLIVALRWRAKRRRELEQLALEREENLVTLEEAEKLLAAQMEAEREAELKLARRKVKTSEEIEREKTRQEVEKYSRENPDEVARLVRAWLAEEQ